MRYFSTSKKFIGWYIQNKYRGSFQLKNGTWVVHQSDDFKRWVYIEGYEIYKSKISKHEL